MRISERFKYIQSTAGYFIVVLVILATGLAGIVYVLAHNSRLASTEIVEIPKGNNSGKLSSTENTSKSEDQKAASSDQKQSSDVSSTPNTGLPATGLNINLLQLLFFSVLIYVIFEYFQSVSNPKRDF